MVPLIPQTVNNNLRQKLNNSCSTRTRGNVGPVDDGDNRVWGDRRSRKHPSSKMRPNC
ncbi:hypothetical protein YC2023_031707 [Brassica napus]